MWISKESEEKKKMFLKMSSEEFDQYMCKTYPSIFRERNLPMSQTCMCWGFNIGKGWYLILDDLCRKLDIIEKITGIGVIFQQIKEKHGGARYYHGFDCSKSKLDKEENNIYSELIDDLVSHAENDSDCTCAECGGHRYEMISIDGWVYDVCDKCFLKLFPDRKGALDEHSKRKMAKENVEDAIPYANDKELKKIGDIANSVIERVRKEQEKLQKKFAKKK
jgi:hypothetical protein